MKQHTRKNEVHAHQLNNATDRINSKYLKFLVRVDITGRNGLGMNGLV